MDVARLREISKEIGPYAVSLIPSLAPKSGHFLAPSDGTSGFLDKLMRPSPTAMSEIGLDTSGAQRFTFKTYVTTLLKHYQEKQVREGVAIVDGLVSPQLETQLMNGINALAQKQEQDEMVDYHPHSNNVVRDLVHPALYSFVEGVSCVREVAPLDPWPVSSDGGKAKGEEEEVQPPKQDFWGRKYENSKYQWLPTTFTINEVGACSIQDYINNLTPRDSHRDLYHALAKLFEQCLPFLESIYSYIGSIKPHLRIATEQDDFLWHEGPLTETREKPYTSFRGKQLQVITKIVDYELQPGQSYEGVWHVEGMSHEEIVMTCLYILDRDGEIEGGNLKFKRAFFEDEAGFISTNAAQDRPAAIDKVVREGLKPLGTVETIKGRIIVFPNSHVHRVTEMINNGSATARRRIVVFFIVNPFHRIVSTREVAPQQMNSTAIVDAASSKKRQAGTMALQEAKEYRLELMKERKHHKQDWNVRDIELCEH